ncbi:hypothetical protein ANO11243_072520 [Dothideomycetidae sp. 11243]|nr:hypothetical protein ANO11243_072520 [fungal sp. No.11243]
MHACNNRPPISIKSELSSPLLPFDPNPNPALDKDKWINKERVRWAAYCNAPIATTAPEGFPPNTISVQRALTAIEMSAPENLAPAFQHLYQTFWVERNPVQDPQVFGAAIGKAMGDEGATKKILDAISSPEVKQRLSKNTEQALQDGAFGLPYFVATNAKGQKEGFWGFDHLGQVMDHLGLERDQSTRAML